MKMKARFSKLLTAGKRTLSVILTLLMVLSVMTVMGTITVSAEEVTVKYDYTTAVADSPKPKGSGYTVSAEKPTVDISTEYFKLGDQHYMRVWADDQGTVYTEKPAADASITLYAKDVKITVYTPKMLLSSSLDNHSAILNSAITEQTGYLRLTADKTSTLYYQTYSADVYDTDGETILHKKGDQKVDDKGNKLYKIPSNAHVRWKFSKAIAAADFETVVISYANDQSGTLKINPRVTIPGEQTKFNYTEANNEYNKFVNGSSVDQPDEGEYVFDMDTSKFATISTAVASTLGFKLQPWSQEITAKSGDEYVDIRWAAVFGADGVSELFEYDDFVAKQISVTDQYGYATTNYNNAIFGNELSTLLPARVGEFDIKYYEGETEIPLTTVISNDMSLTAVYTRLPRIVYAADEVVRYSVANAPDNPNNPNNRNFKVGNVNTAVIADGFARFTPNNAAKGKNAQNTDRWMVELREAIDPSVYPYLLISYRSNAGGQVQINATTGVIKGTDYKWFGGASARDTTGTIARKEQNLPTDRKPIYALYGPAWHDTNHSITGDEYFDIQYIAFFKNTSDRTNFAYTDYNNGYEVVSVKDITGATVAELPIATGGTVDLDKISEMLPSVEGKRLAGWKANNAEISDTTLTVNVDTILTPVYTETIRVTVNEKSYVLDVGTDLYSAVADDIDEQYEGTDGYYLISGFKSGEDILELTYTLTEEDDNKVFSVEYDRIYIYTPYDLVEMNQGSGDTKGMLSLSDGYNAPYYHVVPNDVRYEKPGIANDFSNVMVRFKISDYDNTHKHDGGVNATLLGEHVIPAFELRDVPYFVLSYRTNINAGSISTNFIVEEQYEEREVIDETVPTFSDYTLVETNPYRFDRKFPLEQIRVADGEYHTNEGDAAKKLLGVETKREVQTISEKEYIIERSVITETTPIANVRIGIYHQGKTSKDEQIYINEETDYFDIEYIGFFPSEESKTLFDYDLYLSEYDITVPTYQITVESTDGGKVFDLYNKGNYNGDVSDLSPTNDRWVDSFVAEIPKSSSMVIHTLPDANHRVRNIYDITNGNNVPVLGLDDIDFNFEANEYEFTPKANANISVNFIPKDAALPVKLIAFLDNEGRGKIAMGEDTHNDYYLEKYLMPGNYIELTAVANDVDAYVPAYWQRITQADDTVVLLSVGANIDAYPLGGEVFYQPKFVAKDSETTLYIHSDTREILSVAEAPVTNPTKAGYTLDTENPYVASTKFDLTKLSDATLVIMETNFVKNNDISELIEVYDMTGKKVTLSGGSTIKPAYGQTFDITATNGNENPVWTLKIGESTTAIPVYSGNTFQFSYMFEQGTKVVITEVNNNDTNTKVDPPASIMNIASWNGDGKANFTGIWSLPAGVNVTHIEHGILMADKEAKLDDSRLTISDGEISVMDTDVIIGRVTNTTNPTPIYTISKSLAGTAAEKTWYGRAYLIYSTGEGDAATRYAVFANDIATVAQTAN